MLQHRNSFFGVRIIHRDPESGICDVDTMLSFHNGFDTLCAVSARGMSCAVVC